MLNWTFRAATTAAQKKPAEFEKEVDLMVLRIGFICELYRIPPDLVVNFDQTGVHLAPAQDKTYSTKGSKEVRVGGKDDKRAFTAVVGSSATGELLPLQVIFAGKTSAVLPASDEVAAAKEAGWHITPSGKAQNHWSNLQTMKEYFKRILWAWLQKMIKGKGLDEKTQKVVVIMDCWSVHRSKEFLDWIKANFPNIIIIFVPGMWLC